jgi:hypothetical protein
MKYKWCDWYRCTTNVVHEVIGIFGIEAGNLMHVGELTKVLSSYGAYTDPRHINLLANRQTLMGYLMPASRHGLNRINLGPLLCCSFEETLEMLTEAALYAQYDGLEGVTENIMVGKLSNIGTGCVSLLIPEWYKQKCFQNFMENPSLLLPMQKTISPIFSSAPKGNVFIDSIPIFEPGQKKNIKQQLTLQNKIQIMNYHAMAFANQYWNSSSSKRLEDKKKIKQSSLKFFRTSTPTLELRERCRKIDKTSHLLFVNPQQKRQQHLSFVFSRPSNKLQNICRTLV